MCRMFPVSWSASRSVVAMSQWHTTRTLLLPLITSLFFAYDEALWSPLEDYIDFDHLAYIQPPSEKAARLFPTLSTSDCRLTSIFCLTSINPHTHHLHIHFNIHQCHSLCISSFSRFHPDVLHLGRLKFPISQICSECGDFWDMFHLFHHVPPVPPLGGALHLRAPRHAGGGGLDFSLHQSTGMATTVDESHSKTNGTAADLGWFFVSGKYPLVNIQKTMENHHF